ncbi:hypothetical protein AVEN_14633-1 [Araneus ventricosus]|uniref:Uncharacterized protein n=1 Tax=Araneus ventricosus TaxID=182803 RepID=A0A4Y2S7E4_ARAVE|nr:hypothetical protein AVEN_14633-1 [Araneus ventricosus]
MEVRVKPAIHLYYIPSQHWFFCHLFKSKNQARHSSEAPKCAGSRGERSSLPLYSCSSIPLFSPISAFPIKVALSRGHNLVKSFDVPTILAKGPN